MKTRALLTALLFFLLAAGCAFSQSIEVTAPAAGAVLCHDHSYTISWTSVGEMDPHVKIRLYQNTSAGAVRVLDITDSTANDGSFPWTVPATVAAGGDYYIRVRTVDTTVLDDGERFSISACAASITVSSPMETGAYMVRGATPMTIAWTSSGITGNVRIELEDFATRALTLVNASFPYNGSPLIYPVPDGVAAGTYRVKVSQGSVVGYSGRIVILAYVPPSLTLTQPNGGEILTQGGFYTIEWDAHNLDGNVCIELLRGGVVDQVLAASHFVNTGFFTWRNILSATDGVKHMTGANFKISIRTLDRRFRDVSEGNFTIQAPPGIWVVKPAAGEVWEAGSLKEIRWNAQRLEGYACEIILDFPSGAPLRRLVIASGLDPMAKRYSWRVMDHTGGTYRLAPGDYAGAVLLVRASKTGSAYHDYSSEFTIRKR